MALSWMYKRLSIVLFTISCCLPLMGHTKATNDSEKPLPPLFYAIDKNFSAQKFETLLKNEKNIEQRASHIKYNHMTPLLAAAKKKRYNIAQILIDAGAKIEAKDSHGNTPLLLAAGNNDRKLIKLLVNHGAKINVKNKDKQSPLFLTSSADIVAYLIQAGANIEITNRFGDTPLIAAASRGHTKIVEELLAQYAHVNATDKRGNTALARAAKHNHKTIALKLIYENASIDMPNRYGITPLMRATSRGHTKMIEILLDHGADIHLTTTKKANLQEEGCCGCFFTRYVPEGSSALDVARIFEKSSAQKLLIREGAQGFRYIN